MILDEIRALPVDPLGLPLPRDARLLRIARAILDDPSDERSLEHGRPGPRSKAQAEILQSFISHERASSEKVQLIERELRSLSIGFATERQAAFRDKFLRYT